MISTDDLTAQRQVYTRNGRGRWAVLGYCPVPSVIMVDLNSGERLHFGLGGSYNRDFEPIPGETYEGVGVPVDDRQNVEWNKAIDFAIAQGAEAVHFLTDWREGDTSAWPEFIGCEG